MTGHYRTPASMSEIIENHKENPLHDTAPVDIDELELQTYARSKTGLMTPGRNRKMPGCIGILDFTNTPYNPRTDHPLDNPEISNMFYSDHSREYYHTPIPWFTRPGWSINIHVFFDINTDPDLPQRAWPAANYDDLKNTYNLVPDYIEAQAQTIDPETLHNQQTGLTGFEDVTQAEVHPDALDADDRVADLPAFLPDDHDELVKGPNDPTTGALMECDHCHEEHPWAHPLEKGIDAVRPGGINEGNPGHKTCDSPKTCGNECVCPRCAGKSIPARSTKTPVHRCNNCDLEFDHPVSGELPDGAERLRLFWRCKECGAATRAPFPNIPEELLFS